MSEAAARRIALRDRILEAALLHAPFDGWTDRTLERAARDAGVDVATARRLFPRGGDGLLEWLDDWADRRMLAAVAEEDLAALPLHRRIARLAWARFTVLGPHREALRRAVVAKGLPHNLPGGLQALWRTVDRIWKAAGVREAEDRGLSRYTRRALLAAVLVATFFYWLEDETDDFTATRAFLDRRLHDVLVLGRTVGRLADFLPAPFRRPAGDAGAGPS